MTSTSPTFLHAGKDRPAVLKDTGRVHACVVHTGVWEWDGSKLSGQTGSGLSDSENVQASGSHKHSPPRCALAFLWCTPRHHGNKWCGCVDTAALFFPTLCVFSAERSTAKLGPSSSPSKTN